MNYTFVRVINNNAIVGADRRGEEVILLGKGIGVRCIKHRRYIVASSLIEKVFVVEKKANESYVEELIKTIPFPYIDTVNKVVALAEALLNYSFKDQLFLTLLDHISFSVKRLRAHEDIENPLLNEIRQFYPKEYDAALQAVKLINQELQVHFDDNEAAFIEFHLINYMSSYGHSLNKKMTIIMRELTDIIQDTFQMELDEQSIYYTRFITHLKYFLGRVLNDRHENCNLREEQNIHQLVKEKYQQEWECSLQIQEHLRQKYNVETSDEELGYLTMHIVPMLTKRK